MEKINVLVIDDAIAIRSLLKKILLEEPDMAVRVASNGLAGLQEIRSNMPHVIILDIEMPTMDGLQTLREIRKIDSHVQVILFSALTQRGAEVTLKGLSMGANDYLTKPVHARSIHDSTKYTRQELIPKIRMLHQSGNRKPVFFPEPPPTRHSTPINVRKTSSLTHLPIQCVSIGISTGGPNTLATIIPLIPEDINLPIFIVQHMPPVFTRYLAENLDKSSPLTIREAEHLQEILPNHVYIAPGNHHMTIGQDSLKKKILLNQDPHENSCRPSVDVLLRSVAKEYGKNSLSFILTGMGQDGLLGCMELSKIGGKIVAQDEPTSVVWGMPGAVVQAGIAHKILPLQEIVPELIKTVKGIC